MFSSHMSTEIEDLFFEAKDKKNKKNRELGKQIREEKVPISAFEKICEILNMPKSDLAEIIDISTRTLSRRSKYLKKFEADKLYRVAHILDIAILVLEDKEQAVFWLTTPRIALDNQVPLTMLDTEYGANEVEAMLMRIEYGVYM